MASSTITFTRDSNFVGALTVNFILGGTATFGTDYTIAGATGVTAAGGSVTIGANNSSATMVVSTVPDNTKEADETIIITPIAAAGYTAQGSISLTIQNDEFVPLTYMSDGDSSGLFYYLGTNRQTAAWVNPVSISPTPPLAVLSETFVSSGNVANLTDRTTAFAFTSANSSSFFWDLGDGYGMSVNKYSVRSGPVGSPINWPRNWRVQGSNSALASFSLANLQTATWVDIDVQANSTLNAPNQWLTITTTPSPSFRYLRLKKDGVDASGGNGFLFSEIEFYGVYS